MGRPSGLRDGVQREKVFSFRISGEELKTLRRSAKQVALPVSSFIIQALKTVGAIGHTDGEEECAGAARPSPRKRADGIDLGSNKADLEVVVSTKGRFVVEFWEEDSCRVGLDRWQAIKLARWLEEEGFHK